MSTPISCLQIGCYREFGFNEENGEPEFGNPVSSLDIPSNEKTLTIAIIASVVGGDGKERFAFGFEIPTMPGRFGRQLDAGIVRQEEATGVRIVYAHIQGLPTPLEGTYSFELMLAGQHTSIKNQDRRVQRALVDVRFVA